MRSKTQGGILISHRRVLQPLHLTLHDLGWHQVGIPPPWRAPPSPSQAHRRASLLQKLVVPTQPGLCVLPPPRPPESWPGPAEAVPWPSTLRDAHCHPIAPDMVVSLRPPAVAKSNRNFQVLILPVCSTAPASLASPSSPSFLNTHILECYTPFLLYTPPHRP